MKCSEKLGKIDLGSMFYHLFPLNVSNHYRLLVWNIQKHSGLPQLLSINITYTLQTSINNSKTK